ncbi:uncharacterized protein SPSK_08124 [Sporothrix schenckii 1099-18]|uniref:Uncharacterized protein n=1 Tax=Sporothrix schenckii 1099-18 TaxID=1397361 RepID=A0A0F2MIM9_SPOSC|nr:uncharacterized protein SPSK_08124 [Sporothrix schenckii 1099-18]KJR88924.1 hypothetical protein SPSK_08124 [Sporothrix schenckii 1099-18]
MPGTATRAKYNVLSVGHEKSVHLKEFLSLSVPGLLARTSTLGSYEAPTTARAERENKVKVLTTRDVDDKRSKHGERPTMSDRIRHARAGDSFGRRMMLWIRMSRWARDEWRHDETINVQRRFRPSDP